MERSSIQVSSAMRRRLAKYRVPGMTYEEVLETIVAAVPADAFRARYERAREEALRTVWPSGDREPAAEHRDAHRERARKVMAMTPFERMEHAYRLFAMRRGRA